MMYNHLCHSGPLIAVQDPFEKNSADNRSVPSLHSDYATALASGSYYAILLGSVPTVPTVPSGSVLTVPFGLYSSLTPSSLHSGFIHSFATGSTPDFLSTVVSSGLYFGSTPKELGGR